MKKHEYTNENFPTNTGSLERPARFNLRLTCTARGRTIKVLVELLKEYNLPAKSALADVWEEVALPILEHHIRNVRSDVVPAALKALIRDQAKKIRPEDRERAVYMRLKAKFEKVNKAS